MVSGGILLDQLIAAEVVAAATFAHCWNPVGPTPTHAFRRAAEGHDQPVTFTELSMASINAALLAGAWGCPFMPVPDLSRTSYVKENTSAGLLDIATSTFGTQMVVKAIVPDVAFVYADTIDEAGNASVTTPLGDCVVAAQAARTVIVVAEQLVLLGELDPSRCAIPGALVTAFVIEPGAVKPDGAPGRYARDLEEYRSYARETVTVGRTRAWLDDHVFRGQSSGRGNDR
jgi:glutaconate CoA-transferase, subunit A